MGQPHSENHLHLVQSKNELEHIDFNAIAKMGLDNPVSLKLKSIKQEMAEVEQLIMDTNLDTAANV